MIDALHPCSTYVYHTNQNANYTRCLSPSIEKNRKTCRTTALTERNGNRVLERAARASVVGVQRALD